ncbi:hypothetical protein P4200_25630 [Pseudomonas aeruginosa]|nr:hypothetical protein [Pseudomonas aeruginosa]
MFDDPAVGEVQDPFEPGEIAAGGKDVVVRSEAVGQGADGDPSGMRVGGHRVLLVVETHAGLSSSIPISTGWLIGRYATEIARSGEGKVIEDEVLDGFSFLLFGF